MVVIENIIAVGLGGFIGSVIRYLVALYFYSSELSILKSNNVVHTSNSIQFILNLLLKIPIQTLFVNLIGSLLIGILIALFQKSNLQNESIKLFLTTGLMGGLTTFSTFSFELMDLLKSNQLFYAINYLLLSLIFGIIFCWLGYSIIQILYK